MRELTCSCILIVLLLLAAPALRADTIVLTQGTASVTGLTGGLIFSLAGADGRFAVSGVMDDRGNVEGQQCSCTLEDFGFGAYFAASGPAVFNGQPAWWQGIFSIVSDGVRTVEIADGLAILTAHASFGPETTFIVCTTNPFIRACAPSEFLGKFTVTGAWTVTAVLEPEPTRPGFYFFRSETWHSASAPVPEPATLVLMALGLGGTALKVRRASRRLR